MTDQEPGPLAPYPTVLTTGEVAEILRMGSQLIAAMAKRGELPTAFKLGSGPRAQWRFLKRAIAALVEGNSPDRTTEQLAQYPAVLTTAEAAAVLRLTPGRTAALATQGELPAFKVGTGERAQWRFPRQRLVQLINTPSTPEPDTTPPAG
ncbi:helix-turn-helix domain-containing protein [Streptomyces sp. NBC_01431]|uniref:helix-turn-helix domain-containing protein n=1 Tax=Streptomyces sp. NBC_01431 TaxID=2903863 RepID=UPI002E3277ED|nr:helix-turn-helix domain-containing protein [Streptomyces sp. NBC_01431]